MEDELSDLEKARLAAIEKQAKAARRESLKRDRNRFLMAALDLDDIYREGYTRVQFIKTRYKDAFLVTEPGYTLYERSKRLLSKFEYCQRKSREQDKTMADLGYDMEDELVKKADAKFEEYMKNMLYYSYGIGQLYNQFLRDAYSG